MLIEEKSICEILVLIKPTLSYLMIKIENYQFTYNQQI